MDGTLLVVTGAETRSHPILALAQALSRRLEHPVAVCAEAEAIGGLRGLLAGGTRRVGVLPLVLTLDQENDLPRVIQLASQRWPFLAFHLARPLDWLEWARLVRAVALEQAGGGRLVVTARGGGDPLTDANVARLAWLVGHLGGFNEVVGHLVDGSPGPVGATVDWHEALGHPGLIDCLVARHAEALADDSLQRPVWGEIAAQVHRPEQGEEEALRELDRRLSEILPPGYEQSTAVPMGSAGLLVDGAGQVAWDEMWTSFCDLALAGGPCHRGTLLEPVSAAEALAEPERYASVVAELERGVRLVTGLPTVAGTPGWVGVRCDDEAMAIWMLRAIIVENVMVRREGEVLYLPAGPDFRLEGEIKNVVTVLAKTHHYWTAHLVARRLAG